MEEKKITIELKEDGEINLDFDPSKITPIEVIGLVGLVKEQMTVDILSGGLKISGK